MGRRGTWVAVVLVLALGAGGCGDDDEAAPVEEVAVCDELRRRENDLIVVVNEALAELADADDDAGRAEAIAGGFDRLVEVAARQAEGLAAEGDLAAALRAGADAAVAELEDERDRFAAEVPVVTQADEHGRAGQLQNALEKAFSHMEPPRRAYVEVGLADAIDADPDCRFVTQRADPAR